MFATRSGARMSADNLRSRTLRGAVERANANLAARGLPPLPDKLTRSLLYALGEDPGVVMDEMGHTDPGLALRVYRQSMRRGEEEKAALRALIEGSHWANMGERGNLEPSKANESKAA